jgi:hypothetical protein
MNPRTKHTDRDRAPREEARPVAKSPRTQGVVRQRNPFVAAALLRRGAGAHGAIKREASRNRASMIAILSEMKD